MMRDMNFSEVGVHLFYKNVEINRQRKSGKPRFLKFSIWLMQG
jgi:hypothetical protein